MSTQLEHEASILARLRVMDPQLDTGYGTPIRKLIDAVAGRMSEYDSENIITESLYSIESASGANLDAILAQWGFTRQEANAARGYVRVTRDDGDSVLNIPFGTTFYKPANNTMPAVTFSTTTSQQLVEGVLSADITVVAITSGSEGNVPANTVTRSTGFTGYIQVTNPESTYGGRDLESDADLRTRFYQTVLRNLSGTESQYLGLALAHKTNTRSLVVPQNLTHVETTTILTGMKAQITMPMYIRKVRDLGARFWLRDTETATLYNRSEFSVSGGESQGSVISVELKPNVVSENLGPVSIGGELRVSQTNVTIQQVFSADGDLISPEEYDPVYDGDAVIGIVIKMSATEVRSGEYLVVVYSYMRQQIGDFVTFEFSYEPAMLRPRDVSVRPVEMYVDGVFVQQVSDIQFIDLSVTVDVVQGLVPSGTRIVGLDGSVPQGTYPYVRLSRQPLIETVGTMNVGVSTVLEEGTHFLPVVLDSVTGNGTIQGGVLTGSSRSYDGVVLIGSVESDPNGLLFKFASDPDNLQIRDYTPMNLPFIYNQTIEEVQSLVDLQSVVTMDTLVHQAYRRYFGIYLSVVYSSYPHKVIEEKVITAIQNWANGLPFGAVIQFSDIETIAANVSGVDAVRMAQAQDVPGSEPYPWPGTTGQRFNMVEFQKDGTTGKGVINKDFRMAPHELAVVNFVRVYPKADFVAVS